MKQWFKPTIEELSVQLTQGDDVGLGYDGYTKNDPEGNVVFQFRGPLTQGS